MVMVEGKRGQYKYYILINLILGLMVLAIGIFFIFNEYFTGEGADLEICRQSILLRATAIENALNAGGLTGEIFAELAEEFPFKCKNDVIKIDYYDVNKAQKEIADSIAACHSLYLEGKSPLYAFEFLVWDPNKFKCFVCSRIHFDEDVIDDYSKEDLKIGEYLIGKTFRGDETYFDYVYGNRPSAVSEAELKKQVVDVSNFKVSDGDIFVINYLNTDTRARAFAKDTAIYGLITAPALFTLKSIVQTIYEKDGFFSVVKSFQPSVNPKAFEICEFETIPA